MAQQLSPKQICQQLSLCITKAQDLEIDEAIIVNVVAVPAFPQKLARTPLTKVDVHQVAAPVADDPQCIVCEFVMTKLEDELKDKTSRDEIRTAIENICTIMPNSISKQCNKFIEQYADLIFTLIDTVPPKEICSQMGLCPAQKKQAHLLGASECTWGPSHFCSDHKIAEMCKVRRKNCLRRIFKLSKFRSQIKFSANEFRKFLESLESFFCVKCENKRNLLFSSISRPPSTVKIVNWESLLKMFAVVTG